ncbi:hypothetical protein ACIGN6_28895 [Streptomyces sp. NPDC053792]|uniref:hypothetical protein n=1 Tax=Streptomyces sp. NPDC053792 TaxID=3365716 RepID=UPI0037D8C9B9
MYHVLAESPWNTTWYAVSAIGQAIVAAAVLFGVISIRQARKLRIIAYEDRFEERYWKLMERLSPEALRGAVQPPAPGRTLDDKDFQAVRSYFRLCETQLNVRAAGWITDGTWELWREGIRTRLGHYPFNVAWQEILGNEDAKHLYQRLRQFDAGHREPCRMGYFRRFWRGLTGSIRR